MTASFTHRQGSKAQWHKRALLLLLLAAGTARTARGEDDIFADIEEFFVTAPKISRIVTPDGDTLLHIALPPVFCFSKTKFRNKRAQRRYYEQYYRMIYNLKKTYPYAQIIKRRLADVESQYALLHTERERRAYIKQVERQLFAEFEPHVRRMTISQGRMLIKLVNRETGRTGYSIIKELRGSLSAFFWQTIAAMFSSSLKMEFDATGDDKTLDELIFLYENGML